MASSLSLRFFVIAFAIALSAPAIAEQKNPESPNAARIAAAEKILADGLKDPESAHFRNVQFRSETNAVCGEFNAKNSYGAYVGFKQFTVGEDRVVHRFTSANEIHASNDGEKMKMLRAAMDDLNVLKQNCAEWAKEIDSKSE